jgi:hypothetical protein
MSDPERLLAGAMSDVERDMLRAWDAEQPSAEAHARARAIAGLALGGVLVASVSASGAAGTNVLAEVGSSIAPKAAAMGGAAAKWLAIVAVGLAGAGATAALTIPSRAPVPLPTAPTAVHTFDIHEAMRPWPVTSATAPVPTDYGRAASPAPAPSARPPSPASVHSPHASAAAPPAARPTSLGEQVVSLERARRAMQDGDPALAERRVDEYDATFPGGALREEAEALRIDALSARGDTAAATRVATSFLATYPASIHARRLRALVVSGADP